MATYLVWSGGDNSSGTLAGGWAAAKTTLVAGLALCTTDDDVVLVHYAHTDILTVNTTYTPTVNVSVISVDKDSSNAPTPMGTTGYLGHTTTTYNVGLTPNINKKAYLYGLTFKIAGTGGGNISLANGAGAQVYAESCLLWTNAGQQIYLGSGAGYQRSFVRTLNSTIRFGATNGQLYLRGSVDINGGGLDAAGAAITQFFYYDALVTGQLCEFNGFDFSSASATATVAAGGNIVAFSVVMKNCKLPSSFNAYSLASGIGNESAGQLTMYNCSAGDMHYHLGHFNMLGSTVCDTGIYTNDGAEYNLTGAKFSWKITSTTYARHYSPYISPWIHTHNETLSAITPSLEILRDGSATAYQDDEVWGEFSYQGTTGFPLAVMTSDRMALLGTPANQATGALGAAGWTGEGATAWFGKLAPAASITPAEIGPLSARVCVGEPSITVYVDSQIRT